QGPAARGVGTLKIGFAAVPVHVEKRAAVGDPGVRAGVVGVALDGTLEHAARELDAGAAELVEELPPPQIVLVCLYVLGRRLFDGTLLVLAQHHAQRLDDVPGDLFLDREHVLQLAVVALRPEKVAIAYLSEARP